MAGSDDLAGYLSGGIYAVQSTPLSSVPFLQGHALSIGALSYRGRLHCGVYADAAVVPDAAEVARDLEAAFDALRVVPRAPDTPWRARAVSRRQRAAKR